MPDYKKMYFEMFNAVGDAIEILQKAQQSGEETYISKAKQSLELMRPRPDIEGSSSAPSQAESEFAR